MFSTIKLQQLLLLSLGLAIVVASVSAEGTCSSSKSYFCPNCGGMQVSNCKDCDGFLHNDQDHEICFDRRLFQPHNNDPTDFENHYHFLWNDLVGAVIWFITAGVAMASGVGGGGIYVPLGILLFQFGPKAASGLSQASIFGASLGGLLLNFRDHHPHEKIRHDAGLPDENGRRAVQADITSEQEEQYLAGGGKFYARPLINFDMALFLAPMEMAGAVLGVLIQKLLPNWLYLLLAGIILSLTAYKTYQKFLSTHKKERDAANAKREALGRESEDSTPRGEDSNVDAEDLVNLESMGIRNTEVNGETGFEVQEAPPLAADEDDKAAMLRKQYLEEDSNQYPKRMIASLIVLWIGLFILTLMKGGKGVDSIVGIDCEDATYYVLIGGQFLWLFSFAVYFGFNLLNKQKARSAVLYPYLHDDAIWDQASLRFYGLFTIVAGVVAGLIGIGGGMVLNPLMMTMGLHPKVSSATTATMVVVTSSSVAVIFVTSGLVPWSYAVFYFGVCFFGALFGKSRIDAYVKRTGRASILIFILATIIALATIGCFVILFTRLSEKDWCFDGFNEFCSVADESDCPVDDGVRTLEMFMAQ